MISTPLFESLAAFQPRTSAIVFARSSKTFFGWKLLESRCVPRGLSMPALPPYTGAGVEADPLITPGGAAFTSTRHAPPVRRRVRTSTSGASIATRLGAGACLSGSGRPVSAVRAECYSRVGADGWLNFGSNRPGGFGNDDISQARRDNARRWCVENADALINTAGQEYELAIGADGSFGVISAGDSLLKVRRTPNGWSPRKRKAWAINATASEFAPVLSPTDCSLLFARDGKVNDSGKLFVARFGRGGCHWPRSCPR